MIQFNLRRSSFRGFTRTHRAVVDYDDPYTFYRDVKPSIFSLLNTSVSLRLRIIICISILFSKPLDGQDDIEQEFYFCSYAERVLSRYTINKAVTRCFGKIFLQVENFTKNGSGWVIKKIQFCDVHVGNYSTLRGGCGEANLPHYLKNKKCILNVQNTDNLCFLYALAARLYTTRYNSNRPSRYKNYLKNFKLGGITFPMPVNKIKYFERENKLCINVFGFDDDSNRVYPIYVTQQTRYIECDLLLYKNHYSLIKNFNRFSSTRPHLRYSCKNCLNSFRRPSTLHNHIQMCQRNKPQRVSIPSFDSVKFTNLSKMVKHPFVIYCDFESLTRKVSGPTPSSSSSYSREIERHEAVSYTILVLDIDDQIVFHEFFSGLNVVEQFLSTLKKLSQILVAKLHKSSPMVLDIDDAIDPNKCHICKKYFAAKDIRVRDHQHFGVGFIRGWACQACNLNYRTTYFIPVVIHNCKNYDAHLILKNIPQNYAECIRIIPINMEKFTMFSMDSLKFMDSFQFLPRSLDMLVKNLIDAKHDFKIFNQFFDGVDNSELLLRKGVFPYSYLDSLRRLGEPHLPSKKHFFNVLTNSPISDEDYLHAQRVFKQFKCTSLNQYLELYQNTDVILLAEVFTSFRKTTLAHYQLDPVHFVTGAELTWNAGLKYTKVELKLLKNVDQYIWFESQMRGGISYLGTRYVKANNPYVSDTYNKNLPHNYLLALDVSNLYGFVMQQKLPISNFAWLEHDEIVNFDVFSYDANSNVGFILEVDLDYPHSIHDKTDDLPLAPEHIEINYSMLSPHSKILCDRFNLKQTLPSKKLTPNLHPKRNYITHYLNLRFYLEQGMRLLKIHKIMSFTQENWLESYIEFNNQKRTESRDEFTKSFFKFMNNSFFGRLMLNKRKRVNIAACLNKEDCKKKLSSPLLDYFESVNENLTLFKLKNANLVLDKPIYAGFVILELSKLHMYSLYYNYFKRYYRSDVELLYIDTDSLYLNITSPDAYKDLKLHFSSIMDLSNFDRDHFMYDDSNHGKLGVLKSETIMPIQEFVGLKPKMYAYSHGSNCKMTAKGVKKNVVKEFNIEKYKNTLLEETQTKQIQHSIISKNHNLMTIRQNKVGLSCYYDKRYLLDNGIHSLAYGHYKIPKNDSTNNDETM